MRASKSAVVARLLGTVSKRAAISVILTLCGVVALWFGTNTIDPEHGPDDAGGQVFVRRGFEVEFWIYPWLFGLGVLLLVAALVFFIVYPRLRAS